MKPLVSVVMSVYNGEAFVAEAIESILRQSFEDFEFIIGNDGSTDNTADVLRSLKDKRVKAVHFPMRLTLTRALNELVKRAGGTYIARMDADDVAYPDRLKKQVRFLDEHLDVGLIGSWFRTIDERGKPLKIVQTPIEDQTIRKLVMRFNPVCHPTMMYRERLVAKIGVYDADLNGAEDYDLVLRALQYTQVANIPEVLLDYRIVDTSVSVHDMDRVLRQSQRARLKAIQVYRYPKHLAIHMIWPSITALVPAMVKTTLLKWMGDR